MKFEKFINNLNKKTRKKGIQRKITSKSLYPRMIPPKIVINKQGKNKGKIRKDYKN